MANQPPLFNLPEPLIAGWRPPKLGAGAQAYWALPAEIDLRLDAAYYVITRRPERLLSSLSCALTPLTDWVDVNPPDRRLPTERGYILFDRCRYVEIRDVVEDCWALGPRLRTVAVNKLPRRAAYRLYAGDMLLPRHLGSLHKIAIISDKTAEGDLPLIASNVFVLLRPHSREMGLALLALLHHRVLGEQIWALASGTTTRTNTAADIQTVRVPNLLPEIRIKLAGLVEKLLYAQTFVAFPGSQWPVSLYWQDGMLTQWEQRAYSTASEIENSIDQWLNPD